MKIPAFNEENYFENKMNRSSCVTLINDSCNDAFSNYVSLYVNDGYELLEHREIGANLFSALKKGDTGVFINFHGATDELSIVTEEKTKYFDFKAEAGKSIVSPAITQIPLEDFGMSYVIRLSDGRFIIIDGGRGFEPEIVALYNALTKQSLGNKPVIAAWIMTHAHLDHYQAYAAFMDKYSDSVVIERYMLTFPEYDDLEHYPTLVNKDPRVERDCSEYANIPIMHSWMKKSGAPVYSPFIGQRYVIGDAVLDILGGMEATIHASKNINTTSLVIRMELGGQAIIWGGDASFGAINLAEKYGDFLKADILQVPHHGFQSGPSAEPEICAYKLIKPRVCLLPVSDFDAYVIFCTYRDGAKFLMRDADIEEMITGRTEKMLVLPYTPPAEAKTELRDKYLSGRYSGGSNAWIFTDLNTASPEDFNFTLLNTAKFPTTVWVELFFEDPKRAVRFIKVELPGLSLKSLSIVGDEVDSESIHFGYMSLKTRGIPENAPFAVRFTADKPFVVSHKEHKPAYVSHYNN